MRKTNKLFSLTGKFLLEFDLILLQKIVSISILPVCDLYFPFRLINTVDNLHKEMTEVADNRDALDSQVFWERFLESFVGSLRNC